MIQKLENKIRKNWPQFIRVYLYDDSLFFCLGFWVWVWVKRFFLFSKSEIFNIWFIIAWYFCVCVCVKQVTYLKKRSNNECIFNLTNIVIKNNQMKWNEKYVISKITPVYSYSNIQVQKVYFCNIRIKQISTYF